MFRNQKRKEKNNINCITEHQLNEQCGQFKLSRTTHECVNVIRLHIVDEISFYSYYIVLRGRLCQCAGALFVIFHQSLCVYQII